MNTWQPPASNGHVLSVLLIVQNCHGCALSATANKGSLAVAVLDGIFVPPPQVRHGAVLGLAELLVALQRCGVALTPLARDVSGSGGAGHRCGAPAAGQGRRAHARRLLQASGCARAFEPSSLRVVDTALKLCFTTKLAGTAML